jgi:hypothetical protein
MPLEAPVQQQTSSAPDLQVGHWQKAAQVAAWVQWQVCLKAAACWAPGQLLLLVLLLQQQLLQGLLAGPH